MSRLESEQDCSLESCSSESVVAPAGDSLPEMLASVASGLDLPVAEPVTVVTALESTPSNSSEPTSFAMPVSPSQPKRASRNLSKSKGPTQQRKLGIPSRLWETLRSGRVRTLLTLVGVLMIAGLVGLNLKGSRSSANVDDIELELAEFGDHKSFDPNPVDGSLEAPGAFDNGVANRPIQTSDANEWPGTSPRLPPLGLSPNSDSEVISAGGIEQSSASGPRGAWLTGQIEIESNGIVPVSGSRPNANGAKRTTQASGFDPFPRLKP